MDKIAYLKEKEPEFIPWIEKTKMIPEVKNMDLLSYLIMPIQRTPRYVMLLEDLVKHSPDDHIDNKNLSEALKKMKEVAALINEKKAEVENFKMLVDLYGKLEPVLESLCEPHRRFVFEGELKEEGKTFYFFLFNDIMLKVQEKGSKDNKKYKLLLHINLTNIDIVDIQDDKKTKIKNTFQLSNKSKGKTILLSAKSPEEKTVWIQHILTQKESQHKKQMSFQVSSLQVSSIDQF